VDRTFLAAALRETREEVGILPNQVEILGQVGPSELSLSGLRVWPYVVRLSVTAAMHYCKPFICCDVAN
jgi:8-oxo-dGTP pyrophosphatase MutT (NUDIX family)